MMKGWMNRAGKYFNLLPLFSAAIIFWDFSPAGDRAAIHGSIHNLSGISGLSGSSVARTAGFAASKGSTVTLADSARYNFLYDSLDLDSLSLSRQAYEAAIQGYLAMMMAGTVRNPEVLSIIDFSLPSNRKRLFVLDMENGKLLFNTLVSHGRNSGGLMATRFSNRFSSFMSSVGLYLTGDAFIGQHGYSLRLMGEEKGLNDNVLGRAIVMHPADYVSEEHIREYGYLGRSEGCPAIPYGLNKPIISRIKGGSCLYVYSPSKMFIQGKPFSSGRRSGRSLRNLS